MTNPIIEYDANGKVSHIKFSSDREHWFTCDSSGNVINHKAIQHNVETEESYLPDGNLTYKKDCCGTERYYSPKGKILETKYEDGSWYSHDYDDRGNEIHTKFSYGDEGWSEYDINNNLIHSWDSKGHEVWIEYNDEGVRTHNRWKDGHEEWYDKEGWTNRAKFPDGEEKYYNSDGDEIPNPKSEV